MKETLNAQFDERLKTALKEKDGEIERLAAAMADKESKKINKRKSYKIRMQSTTSKT